MEALKKFYAIAKWFFVTIGTIAVAGWGANTAARAFIGQVAAEKLGPRIDSIQREAKLEREYLDKRFNTLELGLFGKVVTKQEPVNPADSKKE